MGSNPSTHLPREPTPLLTREDARAILGRHVTFSEEWHYDIVLTWAAQGYLRGVLPDECCANLAFVGPKSSGKTTATQLSVLLAGGEMLASGTLAAMIRTFETAGVVGIDELDSNLKKEENLEGILRVGNKWSAVYKICMPGAGGAQKAVDLKIGGPKVFNFRSEIEDALLYPNVCRRVAPAGRHRANSSESIPRFRDTTGRCVAPFAVRIGGDRLDAGVRQGAHAIRWIPLPNSFAPGIPGAPPADGGSPAGCRRYPRVELRRRDTGRVRGPGRGRGDERASPRHTLGPLFGSSRSVRKRRGYYASRSPTVRKSQAQGIRGADPFRQGVCKSPPGIWVPGSPECSQSSERTRPEDSPV